MTAEPEPYDDAAEPLRISSGAAPAESTGPDVVPFLLPEEHDDGTLLYAHRPKIARLVAVVRTVEGADVEANPLQALGVLDGVLAELLEGGSYAYLQERFQAKDDDLDLDVAEPILRELLGVWFARPTGRPRGSSTRPPSQRTGPRSTVRRPSQG